MQRYSMLWAAALLPVLSLYACSNAGSRQVDTAEAEAVADSSYSAPGEVSMNAANIPEKRVKTADLRLRVGNVVESTVQMERIVTRAGGVVEESEIRQAPARQNDTRYTRDSLRRVTWYAPQAHLRLRLPVSKMDSVVHSLTAMAAFVEFRTLTDTDMSLNHLRNNLLNDLSREQERPVTHTKENKELDVRQYQENAQRGAVGRTIENLGIDQLAAFSAIEVELSQPEMAVAVIIPDPERFSQNGFAAEALLSFNSGVQIFRSVLLFFIAIWPLLLTAAFTWFAYRKWFPRLKASLHNKPQARQVFRK